MSPLTEHTIKAPEGPLGSSGRTIPLVGFGTADYPPAPHDVVKNSVLSAIKVGYRHFDTAAIYFSEQPLGDAIAEAIQLGLIKSRDDLFITSKLWITDALPHLVLPALQKTLKNLGLKYLDLYLIHWPIYSKQEEHDWVINKEDLLPLDYENVWKAMEECQNAGLTLSIGVCNFSCKKLDQLLSTAKISPAVNQVEMNPCWQQKKLREFCMEKGIHITAYAPLGAKGTPWGSIQVMESKILKEIAKTKGKTLVQVCLRWVHEQGVSLLVKSFNEERMKQNLEIFDWSLSLEDLSMIERIPQNRGTRFETLISDQGPFKSLSELWDEEI